SGHKLSQNGHQLHKHPPLSNQPEPNPTDRHSQSTSLLAAPVLRPRLCSARAVARLPSPAAVCCRSSEFGHVVSAMKLGFLEEDFLLIIQFRFAVLEEKRG
ncbi:unnamed protein product, partial [Tilletia caries]